MRKIAFTMIATSALISMNSFAQDFSCGEGSEIVAFSVEHARLESPNVTRHFDELAACTRWAKETVAKLKEQYNSTILKAECIATSCSSDADGNVTSVGYTGTVNFK